MRQLQCCFHNEKGAESLLRKSGGLQVHTDGYSSPSPDGDQAPEAPESTTPSEGLVRPDVLLARVLGGQASQG